MFFEINDRAKRRASSELCQLHHPVRLRDREGAVGCAKIEPDCFYQGGSLHSSPTPIADSPAVVALVSVLVAPGLAPSSVAFLALAVHLVVVRIALLHAVGRGVAAWRFLRRANLLRCHRTTPWRRPNRVPRKSRAAFQTGTRRGCRSIVGRAFAEKNLPPAARHCACPRPNSCCAW